MNVLKSIFTFVAVSAVIVGGALVVGSVLSSKNMNGKKDMIKGKTNEIFGKTTDDDTKKLKGKTQEKIGQAKEAADDVAEKIAEKGK